MFLFCSNRRIINVSMMMMMIDRNSHRLFVVSEMQNAVLVDNSDNTSVLCLLNQISHKGRNLTDFGSFSHVGG